MAYSLIKDLYKVAYRLFIENHQRHFSKQDNFDNNSDIKELQLKSEKIVLCKFCGKDSKIDNGYRLVVKRKKLRKTYFTVGGEKITPNLLHCINQKPLPNNIEFKNNFVI